VTEGVIFDLGYQPHEGERLGRAGAVRALYRDGLRRVLGLRRRARSKVLPVLLLSIAVLPALFFVGIGVFTKQFEIEEVEFFSHAQYFGMTSTIAMIFTALAAGELLVPDRTFGTLAVYASRPLTIEDYLAGRAASLVTVVFGFMYLPQLVLFFGRAWVSSEGFGSYVAGNLDTLWRTAAASAIYFIAFAPLAFAVAAFARRASFAAGTFIGLMVISTPVSQALVEADFSFAAFLSIQQHPGLVRDWIMGENTNRWIPERAGYGPIPSLIVILTLAVLAIFLVVRRYRRLT
jgi:hypothetical protein